MMLLLAPCSKFRIFAYPMFDDKFGPKCFRKDFFIQHPSRNFDRDLQNVGLSLPKYRLNQLNENCAATKENARCTIYVLYVRCGSMINVHLIPSTSMIHTS